MKADFLFAGLNRNRTFQKKKCQKKAAHFIAWCFPLQVCWKVIQALWRRGSEPSLQQNTWGKKWLIGLAPKAR